MEGPLKYLKDARDILKKAHVEGNRYSDVKTVKEACGVGYLAILKAVDVFLQDKGLSTKELPRTVGGYRKALKKHLATRDGILFREFNDLYDELHVAGYCGGFLHSVNIVKAALKAAKMFIDKIGQ